jgi:Tol biopolymer transport system component
LPFTPGTRLGVYEIIAPIGEGGMGQVFRARDTKLDRDVAIKILPEAFAHDADRLARFAREAKVLASLNHPHIAGIYGLEESGGGSALVMELVEGQDLSQRIARGAIPIHEALPIATQIAEALEAAHERGIIHRDLKPANIKVRSDGAVKVLDFGLAKMAAPAAAADSGTIAAEPTIEGTVLGTPHYMSPEQAVGADVDRRADIWAFGCVLFEMLAGRRPFAGSSLTSTIHDQPDWAALPAATPAGIRRALERCLQKDRRQRLRDIGDIDWDDQRSDARAVADQAARSRRITLGRLIAMGVAGIAIGAATIALRPGARPGGARPSTRASLALDNLNLVLPPRTTGPVIALSPDGRRLVYVATREPARRLWLRTLDRFDAEPIPGTEGSYAPFFSPDGRWVAYLVEGQVRKVSLAGGVPLVVSDLRGDLRGGTWLTDDTMVIGGDRLVRVPASGGVPTDLVKPDPGARTDYRWPKALPDARGVLAVKVESNTNFEIVAIPFDAPVPRTIVKSASNPVLVSGFLLFAPQLSSDANTRFRSLFAVAFDPEHLQTKGAPFPVIDALMVRVGGTAEMDVTRDGTMVALMAANAESTMVWADRAGTTRPFAERPERAEFQRPRLSHDGSRVAVTVQGRRPSLYVYNVADGTRQRVATENGEDYSPAWSPDDRWLASDTDGRGQIVWRDLSNAGARVTRVELNQHLHVSEWTRDGRFILFEGFEDRRDWDVKALDVRSHEVTTLVSTPGGDLHGIVSTDGRWLACTSNQAGRVDVMVQPFRREGAPVRVSPDGGDQPAWSADGRELFFQNGAAVFVVAVPSASSAFTASMPRRLFTGSFQPGFEVTPDGREFLMRTTPDEETSRTAPARVRLALNWLEEVAQRAASPGTFGASK